MPATLDKLTPLQKAQAALKPVVERDDDLEQRVRRYTDTLAPYTHSHERRPPTADEILEAEGFLGETKVEFAKTRLERRKLEAEVERLRVTEREQLRATAVAEERKLVAQLEDALRVAIVINEKLRAKQQARHELTSEYVDRVSWMGLTMDDGGQFDLWLKSCRANGLVD